MLESEKQFIRRQIKEFIKRDLSEEEILDKSLSILKSPEMTNKAIESYKKSNDLVKTLSELGVIELNQSLLNVLEEKESKSAWTIDALISLLDTNETISQTFSLLKARLSAGLSYALWLSITSTTVFSLIVIKVLPQFKEMFDGFGAELPQATNLAIAWHNSLLSPDIIGLLFIFLIGSLLILIHILSKNKTPKRIMYLIPFINKVIHFTDVIRWLGQLQVLSSSGIKLKTCFDKLPIEKSLLKNLSPDMTKELFAAESIGNLETELTFQSNQLTNLAEETVVKAARRFVTIVMALVATYVAFTIYACYLPIFQLGAVI